MLPDGDRHLFVRRQWIAGVLASADRSRLIGDGDVSRGFEGRHRHSHDSVLGGATRRLDLSRDAERKPIRFSSRGVRRRGRRPAGVLIKLAGQLETNPVTGQLTIVLRELPQLPIGDLELHFFGGERALLSTPPTCGPATSTGDLTPWSGGSDAIASSAFEIDRGADGTPCSGSGMFSPTFQVDSTRNRRIGHLRLADSAADARRPGRTARRDLDPGAGCARADVCGGAAVRRIAGLAGHMLCRQRDRDRRRTGWPGLLLRLVSVERFT